MKLLVALVLWAQLLSCKAAPPLFLAPPRTLACDDPETEQAAAVALDYINSHTLHGYKQVINRRKNVEVFPRRPFGELFNLDLDLLETECHLVDPKPAANCTVRHKTSHAVAGHCKVRLLKLEGVFTVLSATCHSSPDPEEDLRKFCPNCQHLVALNDTDGVQVANIALSELNAAESTVHIFKLLEISRVQTSFSPEVYVEFAIVTTNCSVQEGKANPENCHLATGQNLQFGFCKATGSKTDGQLSKVVADCVVFGHQPGVHHPHLTVDHFEGKLPPPGLGHRVHDLNHSHNGTAVRVEPPKAEVADKASPVVKRESEPAPPVSGTGLPVPVCPGMFLHFILEA